MLVASIAARTPPGAPSVIASALLASSDPAANVVTVTAAVKANLRIILSPLVEGGAEPVPHLKPGLVGAIRARPVAPGLNPTTGRPAKPMDDLFISGSPRPCARRGPPMRRLR